MSVDSIKPRLPNQRSKYCSILLYLVVCVILTVWFRQGEELKQCRERLLQLTQSETALKTELKMIRENEKEKVSTLNETLETLRADFEEQRGAFDSLQKEKVKLEHDLDMQIKQVIEKEVKAKDLESKLASKASELELELNRNKELISGQESE